MLNLKEKIQIHTINKFKNGETTLAKLLVVIKEDLRELKEMGVSYDDMIDLISEELEIEKSKIKYTTFARWCQRNLIQKRDQNVKNNKIEKQKNEDKKEVVSEDGGSSSPTNSNISKPKSPTSEKLQQHKTKTKRYHHDPVANPDELF